MEGLFLFLNVNFYNFNQTGNVAPINSEHQESAFISTSAPDLSISSFRSDSPAKKNEDQVQPTEGERFFKKQNRGRRAISSVLSPGSASSVRQSPRLKV